jgi:ketosteroid isomerase-like protein
VSRENEEAVRAVNEAWVSGEVGHAMGHLSGDVVWEAIEEAPDAGTYRGHQGVRSYFEDWLGHFELEMELGEARKAWPSLVVSLDPPRPARPRAAAA